MGMGGWICFLKIFNLQNFELVPIFGETVSQAISALVLGHG